MELLRQPRKIIIVNSAKSYSVNQMALFILIQDSEVMRNVYLEGLIKVWKKEFNLSKLLRQKIKRHSLEMLI